MKPLNLKQTGQLDLLFQKELDLVNLTFLRYMMAGISIFYLVRGLSYISFDLQIRFPLITVALLSSLYGFIIFFVINKEKFPLNYINLTALSSALILIINVLLNYFLTEDPIQIYFCFGAIIAFSLTTTRMRIWSTQLGIGACAYFFMVLDQTLNVKTHGTFFSGLVISAVFLFSRRAIIKTQINLLLESREKNIELEKVNVARNQFLTNVSHEFRTPLTSIAGAHEIILSGDISEMSPRAADFLKMAKRNTDNLIHLVNDFLEMEKLTSEGLLFETNELCLDDLVDEVVKNNLPMAIKMKRLIKAKLGAKGLIIKSDALRLTQVLNNLISNAIKFSFDGSEIVIETTIVKRGWRIEVINTGRPIPEKFGTEVFERFKQVDMTDNREKGGIGVGLNICKEIINGLGGDIGFFSGPKELTTFYISFELED